MNCAHCQSVVGCSYTIGSGTFLGCEKCNGDLMVAFPTMSGIYMGITEDLFHVYELQPKVDCPHCGQKLENLIIPCFDGGGASIELPLLIEIPVGEEVK